METPVVVIQNDDLKFDGNNIIVPSYRVDTLLDFICTVNLTGYPDAIRDDIEQFKSFLTDVQEYKNQGN